MVRYEITARDTLGVRFAVSPLCESALSLRTLLDPDRFPLQQPWVAATRHALGGVDVGFLRSLGNARNHWPDFLTPPPTALRPTIDDELDALAATDPDRVRADVEEIHGSVPAALAGPDVARRTAEAMRGYWHACVAPHWPTMRAVLDADVTHRSHQLARRGLRATLDGLGPTVHVDGGTLTVDSRSGFDGTWPVPEGAITLMPTLFSTRATFPAGPTSRVVVMYAARGQGGMWHRCPPVDAGAVGELLGATRATLLRLLDRPGSTAALATRLGVTPSAVNQHLRVMQRAGLLASTRHGRQVLYHRTSTGDALAAGAQAVGNSAGS